jgi:hypothetical protein
MLSDAPLRGVRYTFPRQRDQAEPNYRPLRAPRRCSRVAFLNKPFAPEAAGRFEISFPKGQYRCGERCVSLTPGNARRVVIIPDQEAQFHPFGNTGRASGWRMAVHRSSPERSGCCMQPTRRQNQPLPSRQDGRGEGPVPDQREFGDWSVGQFQQGRWLPARFGQPRGWP